MDKSATFKSMDRLKDGLLDGGTGNDGLIRESEAQDRIERAERKAAQDKRDELLSSIYKETELTASDIANCSALEIGGSRIRQIAKGDS